MTALGVAQARRLQFGRALRSYGTAVVLDPTHRPAQHNIRGLLRLAVVLLAVFGYVAAANASQWLPRPSDLDLVSWGGLAIVAIVLVAVARLALTRWRRLPGPVLATARGMFSIRRYRRSLILTPGAAKRAWGRLTVIAFFAVGGVANVIDPEQSGDRTGGLVTLCLCILIGGPTVRRLWHRRRRRWSRFGQARADQPGQSLGK
jgi:hypothetical protein